MDKYILKTLQVYKFIYMLKVLLSKMACKTRVKLAIKLTSQKGLQPRHRQDGALHSILPKNFHPSLMSIALVI